MREIYCYCGCLLDGQVGMCRQCKEASPKVEAKMGTIVWHRWRCSCCDLVKAVSAMDTRWRWNGSAFEHKCEGNDPQAGYFDCTDIDHQPVEDVAHVSPATPAGHPEFYKIVEEMKALHEKKAKDYGSGEDPLYNVRAGGTMVNIPAWQAAVLRMNDKMVRIASFIKKGKLENEGVEDSLQDIAAYAIIALILKREVVK